MATKTITVGSTVGLHARPAALIAQAASAAATAVTLSTESKGPVDAGSALLIMTLGAQCGDKVTVDGDDEALVAEIAGLVEQNLDD